MLGRSNLRRSLKLLDAALVALTWAIVTGIPVLSVAGRRVPLLFGLVLLIVTLITVSANAAGKLYLARVAALRSVQTAGLARASVTSTVAMYVLTELGRLPVSAPRLLAGGVVCFFMLLIGRTVYGAWVASLRRRGINVWPVILVGGNSEAADLHRLATEHPERGIKILGLVSTGDLDGSLDGVQRFGGLAELDAALAATGATGVLIASTSLHPGQINDLVRRLSERRVHIQMSTGLQGIAHQRLRMAPLAYEPLLYLEPMRLSQWQFSIKRCMDALLAGALLLCAGPLLALAAVLIHRHDDGPVVFRQKRVGLHGEVFELLKLRTMVMDAEARLADLAAQNQRNGGPLFKLAGDPRVTPIGRLLRATSIDELPQLVNVLRGEMSLVGPRPALPSEAEEFSSRLSVRVNVLPGITGLWQVEARDSPSFWSYERLDLFYVDNWSVGLDLSIILSTIAVVTGRSLKAVLHFSSRGRERSSVGGLIE